MICPELFLATIYLMIILTINLFLLKQVINSIEKFYDLQQFKKVVIYSNSLKEKNIQEFSIFFEKIFKKQNSKKFFFLPSIDDILLIGTYSKFFAEKDLFFLLFQKQFLSTKINVE